MDNAKFVPLLVGLLIAVVMIGAVFVPVVQSSTSRTVETITQINDGAEWVKLGYNEGTDYSFTVGFDGEDNFTVGTQTGEYENMICYADNQRTLFVYGDYWYLLTIGVSPTVHKFTDNASVTNASGTLTILDGSDTIYTGASPTWAYVPDENGYYGFFTDGGLTLEEGKPTVAVGSYANAYAYNNQIVDLNGIVLDMEMAGNYATGNVTWVVPSNEELDNLSLQPFNPSIQPIDLDVEPSAGLMNVNPSNGTQVGDLYYTFSGTKATVVGYSSSIDWASFTSIPNTVDYGGVTYTVTGIGITAFKDCANLVLTSLPEGLTIVESQGFYKCSSLALTSLPEGLTDIQPTAFRDCSSLALTSLPEGLTELKDGVFTNCTNLALTSLPKSLIKIGTYEFYGNTAMDSLIIQSNLITLADTSFSNTNIKEVLNLGSYDITTTTAGLNADSVQNYIGAIGYIAPVMGVGTAVVPIDSPVAGLMQMLPLIAGVGALLFAVGTMIYTRF